MNRGKYIFLQNVQVFRKNMRKVNVLAFDEKYIFIDTSLSHVCSTYMDPRINTSDPVDRTFSRFSFLCSNPKTPRVALSPRTAEAIGIHAPPGPLTD